MCATKICTFIFCLVICVIHKTNSLDVDMSRESLYNISSETFQKHDVREIEKLDLSYCSISNIHANSFENMNKLIVLDLFRNNIQILSDDTFAQTTNLKELDLYENKIEVFPKNILANLKSLEKIDLSYNNIRVLHPNTFENNKNLTKLECVSNNIEELPQNIFNKLTSLEVLLLFNNSISTIAPTTFDQNTQLVSLDLRANKLTEIKAGTFTNLLKLKSVYLDYNEIHYIEKNAFPVTSELEDIFLGYNKLQYLDPDIISNLNDKVVIGLHDNPWKCSRRIKPLLKTLKKYGTDVPACAEPAALAGKAWDELQDADIPAPVLTISPAGTTHYAGGSVELSCRITGGQDLNSTNVLWRKESHKHLNLIDNDRFRVESNFVNGSLLYNLHITDVCVEDGGLYECIYQDELERLEGEVNLSVQDVDKKQD